MSAYVVGKDHIDALIAAGLNVKAHRHESPLRWFDPAVPVPDDAREAGTWWGPGTVGWARAAERELTPETANRVGAMLWSENVRSVCFRYDEPEDAANLPGPIDFGVGDVAAYRYERFPVLTEAQVLMGIHGYSYQSCEHPGWERSEAKAFVDALKDRLTDRMMSRDLENDPRSFWEITREGSKLPKPERVDYFREETYTPTEEKSGRAPSGRLRNFGAMGAEKFADVYRQVVVVEGNDPEAIVALETDLRRRKADA